MYIIKKDEQGKPVIVNEPTSPFFTIEVLDGVGKLALMVQAFTEEEVIAEAERTLRELNFKEAIKQTAESSGEVLKILTLLMGKIKDKDGAIHHCLSSAFTNTNEAINDMLAAMKIESK